MSSLVVHIHMLKIRTPFFQYITPREWVNVSISCFESSGNDCPVMWSYVPGKKGVLNHNSVQTTNVSGTIWVLDSSVITYFLGLLNTEKI